MADLVVSQSSQTSQGINDLGSNFKETEFSHEEHAALDSVVWRKFDLRVLPLCTGLYIIASVDWTNIGNADVAGLQLSLGMSNYQYTTALMASFVSLIIVQLPFALLLRRVGFHVMLPAIGTLWAIISACQGFVKNSAGLLACRFLLGLVEAGIFPGIVLYLSLFYPRDQLQKRIAVFYSSAMLCNAFSGLLAAAIDHINNLGGKPGWAWIFILEGAFSLIFSAICFFLLPRSPDKAAFLTERERVYVVFRLKYAGSVSEDENNDDFSWGEVVAAVKSPHVWFVTIVCFFDGTILLGLAYFEPTIVASLGYSGSRAQLMSVPPFVTAFVLALISAVISDRYHCRGYNAIFFSVLGLIGFVMFYASTSARVRYASLYFSVTGIFSAAPCLVTWLSNNSAPHARRATAVALITIVSQAGGILATWLLGYISPGPDYTAATIAFIGMSVGMVVFSAINWVYLWQQNKGKAARREKMGGLKGEGKGGLSGDRTAWFVYSL